MSTISDVVDRSRELLQDTVTPYRYSDERLVGAINSCLREMFRHRPDLFLSLNYIIPTIVEDDISGATVLPIEEQYFSPIVEYIVGVTELSDDEFTVEGRAVALLSAFRIALLGVGR